ncbi:hypothetical protein JCM16814_34560 [Desulfobaculum senezii]
MNIEHISATESHFKVNKDFENGDELSIDTQIAVESCYHKDTQQGELSLTATTHGPQYPFSFSVTFEAAVNFSEEDQKHIDQLCNVNLPAIVFPYVREFIADLTRRAGFPPLHIQAINFAQAAKDKTTSQETQQITE